MVEISVNKDVCIGCGLCVHDCPEKVYELRDGHSTVVNQDDCISCLSCHEICPANAIEHRDIYLSRRLYVDLDVCGMLRRII
jgi:L-aspartate semialdehyde sulfurtransferase ferredoxin